MFGQAAPVVKPRERRYDQGAARGLDVVPLVVGRVEDLPPEAALGVLKRDDLVQVLHERRVRLSTGVRRRRAAGVQAQERPECQFQPGRGPAARPRPAGLRRDFFVQIKSVAQVPEHGEEPLGDVRQGRRDGHGVAGLDVVVFDQGRRVQHAHEHVVRPGYPVRVPRIVVVPARAAAAAFCSPYRRSLPVEGGPATRERRDEASLSVSAHGRVGHELVVQHDRARSVQVHRGVEQRRDQQRRRGR